MLALVALATQSFVLAPGDVLYIPPWCVCVAAQPSRRRPRPDIGRAVSSLRRWWHEIVLESPGFSFGVSTRGMGSTRFWHNWPLLRFLLPSHGVWSVDLLALDMVHSFFLVISGVLYEWKHRPPQVEDAQHGNSSF